MIRYFLVILLILCLSGCTIEKSPARVSFEAYLKDLKNENYDNAYQYFSESNKSNCPVDQFKKNAIDSEEFIQNSRLIFKNERKTGEKIKINFLIQLDDSEIDLFEPAIMDPYAEDETAQLVFENSEWKLDNMIWPVSWCEAEG